MEKFSDLIIRAAIFLLGIWYKCFTMGKLVYDLLNDKLRGLYQHLFDVIALRFDLFDVIQPFNFLLGCVVFVILMVMYNGPLFCLIVGTIYPLVYLGGVYKIRLLGQTFNFADRYLLLNKLAKYAFFFCTLNLLDNLLPVSYLPRYYEIKLTYLYYLFHNDFDGATSCWYRMSDICDSLAYLVKKYVTDAPEETGYMTPDTKVTETVPDTETHTLSDSDST